MNFNRINTICLCGGGSLTHALAAVLGAAQDNRVHILTRRPSLWSRTIRATYRNLEIHGNVEKISNNPAEVVANADLVLLTVPAYGRQALLQELHQYVTAGSTLGFIPGHGGADWLVGTMFGKSIRSFGTHRTPYICRTEEYGCHARITGISPELVIGGHPNSEMAQLARVIGHLFNIPTHTCESYLAITLTPGNQIMHPCRLYSIFGAGHPTWSSESLFYGHWSDAASELCFACDDEVQTLRSVLNLKSADLPSIREHYKISSFIELTARIRSLEPLQAIHIPYVSLNGSCEPDISSRFFREDFEFGALVLKCIAATADVSTPTLDRLLQWAGRLLGRSWLDGSQLLMQDVQCPHPLQLGLRSMEEIVEFGIR